MFSSENPEAKKEYAREVLKMIAEVITRLPEGSVDSAAQTELDQLHQEYYNLTGIEVDPDMIAEAIDASF